MRIVRDLETAKSTLLKRSPLGETLLPEKRKRGLKKELTPDEVVDRIISEVRSEGDRALYRYSQRLDGVDLIRLEVSKEEVEEAYRGVSEELVAALTLAAERVRSFHLREKSNYPLLGVDIGERELGSIARPLERVGIYAPGGGACYPSTVLMTAIPARVAGVDQVILATPPGADGLIPAPTLVAADIAKVDRVFKVGGAQAIAALAFGTETIPRVDKVCGPGNIFVVLAKRKVYGVVAIDGLHGPTETVILADSSADPALCAADLLAQAEHDELASAILITTSAELARQVEKELERQLAELERREIAGRSLEQRGGIIIVDSMAQAISLVNSYAPEHLCLMVRDAWSYVGQIRNAGGIFVGSPEALGDYVAGPSHVMPTGGTARWGSPLGISDFIKLSSLVSLGDEALKALGPAAAAIARAEGLTAHAKAIEARLFSSSSGDR